MLGVGYGDGSDTVPAFQKPLVQWFLRAVICLVPKSPIDNEPVLPAVKQSSAGFLPATCSAENNLGGEGKGNDLRPTLVSHPRTLGASVMLGVKTFLSFPVELEGAGGSGTSLGHLALGSMSPVPCSAFSGGSQKDDPIHSQFRDLGSQRKSPGKDAEKPRGEGPREPEEHCPCIGYK